MEVYISLLLIIFCCSASTSAQRFELHEGKTRGLPVVDALISRLQRERREAGDGACLRATLDMLQGVNNNTLWATWVWDSMQLPAGSLYGAQAYIGNYDQCLQAPWSPDQRHPGLRSQYCLVDVKGPKIDQIKTYGPFDNTEDYYRTPTSDGRRFNHHYFGACLPSICSPSSVARISQHIIQLTHLPKGDVTVDPGNCKTAGEASKYPTGFYVFWTVLGMLFTTTVISTIFSSEKQTALGVITRSFCMKRNYDNLFTVSRDEVKVMHGMRFITAAVIVVIHEVYFTVLFPIINGLDVNKFMTSPLGLSLMHIEIVVDTFFAISGLLLIRGLLKGKQKNVFYTLVKRYIRLIGPFAICVLYYTSACEFMGSGPVWRSHVSWETEVCAKHWWKNLLMANTDINTCHCVTWYISCDFQMAVFGTFLFCLFRRNKKLGISASLLVAMAFMVNLGLTVYWNQLDIIPFNFRSISMRRAASELNAIYSSTHVRAGPYLVGMVMGYIINTYKPAEHRRVIGKKWSRVIAAVSLLVAVTMLAIGCIFAGRSYDPLESAVVVATNRVLWGVAVCALIGVCEYGNLSLISEFLSWPGFVPLSKLSYCVYLLHSILIQLQKYSMRSAISFSIYHLVMDACGVLVVTCGFSLVLHLMIEAPLINISSALLTEQSKSIEQNGTTLDTRHNINGVAKPGLQLYLKNKDKLC